ncbi:Ig-like domain-containing protein [Corynebacterium sp. CCM 9185]|uniref:L,D-transpeptidase family protein n=1 Tax=Corynebacterium marambiense TaxID=2765364 RepID=A0ABS0W1E3_9CORY|nr:Ig-like domain-containing protein [Corynebacterium marambiense]MBI9001422.1 L,D-transpeptidase family protein [Corynebacterium marambiense]MCK7664053.1 Ig-like domain-containing protein [Corynebacterium marambiense]
MTFGQHAPRAGILPSFLTAVAVAGLLAGCTIDSGNNTTGNKSSSPTDATTTPAEPLKPAVSIPDGSTDVNPREPVTVKALEGTLEKVVMTNQDGYEVEAILSDDGTTWETSEVLGYYRTYTITATGSNGTERTTTFSTPQPAQTASVALAPLEGSTVGIGQTIAFRFGMNVPDRQAAEDAIEITTNPPVEGAFYWLNNHEVRWRPEEFWGPGTEVTVKADIYGKDLGGGIWGDSDNATNFTIGDSVIAYADDNTKQLKVTKNGEVLRSIPISMGSPRFPTPNGTYIIGDQFPDLVMDSSTYGTPVDHPDGYRTNVKYATQMSYSGIYVHAAPWSVWAQGSQNVSHGCLNVSTDNAQWFQNTVKRGDVVIVSNTQGAPLSGWDGLGDWNIPWETWKAGNTDENQ